MKKKVLLICFVLAASLLISVIADVAGTFRGEVLVNIPDGSTGREIVQILKKEEIINNAGIFKFFARSDFAQFKSGVHKIEKGASFFKIIKELKLPGAATGGIMVTIPEGFEMREIAHLMEEKGICTADSFFKAAKMPYAFDFLKGIPVSDNYLEGFLFPETYEFLPASDAQAVIKRMLSEFDKMFDEKYEKRLEEIGFSLHEAVTLASIIEREAALESERAKVSSVFHNRLKSDRYPYLQSCATVQYLLKERKPVLSVTDTKIDSPYNTYKYKGLPPGPIASPGKASLEAALYPADTDYYFFVADDNKKHIFSKTYEEHLKAQGE